MRKCKQCGSYAINHDQHGRDGSEVDLCDVCYWRKRADDAMTVIASLRQSLADANKRAEAAEAKLTALIENRTVWPEDLRNAVIELENRFDCEMVSIEHHARWVDLVETAERERDAALLAARQGERQQGDKDGD